MSKQLSEFNLISSYVEYEIIWKLFVCTNEQIENLLNNQGDLGLFLTSLSHLL